MKMQMKKWTKMIPLQLQKVLQQPFAFQRQDRFRMELDTVNRKLPVTQPHDLLFRGFRRDFQAVRKGLPFHQ